MTKIYADNYADGWKQFTGGYWAKIIIPAEEWTIRPDGSIAGVKVVSSKSKQKTSRA